MSKIDPESREVMKKTEKFRPVTGMITGAIIFLVGYFFTDADMPSLIIYSLLPVALSFILWAIYKWIITSL
ncbi:hypothetical protein [Virgibacillus sediminis]|uniref:Uncharacterized protein n=1 Tax=Virgibacillus sediminis TaxID=202260 RepID=A0ABV7A8J0_9BACI